MVCHGIISKRKRSKQEDHRLANWRKWLAIRRRFHENVYKIQKRLPVNLLINAAENRRDTVQDKMILEYTNIPQPDKIRGNPNFWSLPPALKRFPSLTTVLPKEKNYEIPIINYVGVPTIMKEEKGILSGKSQRKDLWLHSKYRIERVTELQEPITRVLPHKPEIDDLVIIGKGAKQNLHIKEVEIPNVADKETSIAVEDDNKRTALQIEGHVFDLKDETQDLRRCYVSMEYIYAFHDKVQSKITLRNIGKITLRYYWKRVIPERDSLDIIPYRPLTFSFAFKKNETKILPGDSKVLPIYFKTKRLGIHQECWELCTEPNVFKTGKLLLMLWANAQFGNTTAIENSIRERIEEGMKNTIITDTLLDTLNMVRNLTKSEESILSEEPLTEKDIFEASNAFFSVSGSLPFIYHYDEQLVQDLQNLYIRLKCLDDPVEWNYQIEDVRQAIENCDDLEEKNNCCEILERTIDNLYKSKLIENVDEYKYTRIYNLLKIAFDTMTERVYDLRAIFRIPLIETFPIVDKEMYLRQEQEDIERRARTYPDIIETDSLSKIRKLKPGVVFAQSENLKTKQGKNVKRKLSQKEKRGTIDEYLIKDKQSKGKEKKKEKDKKGKRKSKANAKRKTIVVPPIDLVPENIVLVPDYMQDNTKELCPCSIDMYECNLYNTVHTFVSKIVSKVDKFLEYFETQKLVSQDILKKRIQLGIPITQIDENRQSALLFQQQNWKDSVEMSDTFSFTTESSDLSDSLSNLSNAYSSCYDLQVMRSCFDLKSLQHALEIETAEADANELNTSKSDAENLDGDVNNEKDTEVATTTDKDNELKVTSTQYLPESKEEKTKFKPKCKCELNKYN